MLLTLRTDSLYWPASVLYVPDRTVARFRIESEALRHDPSSRSATRSDPLQIVLIRACLYTDVAPARTLR